MEWGVLGAVLDDIVGVVYHQLHFVELRIIQKRVTEMWWTHTLHHLILCVHLLENEGQGPIVYMKLGKYYVWNIDRC